MTKAKTMRDGSAVIGRVTRNLSFQAIITVAQVGTTFGTISIATHRLGLHAFGIIALYAYCFGAARTVADFGFSIQGVAEAAARRNDKGRLAHLVYTSFYVKFVLLVVLTLCTVIVTLLINALGGRIDIWLAVFSLLSAVVPTLQPVWLMVGIERHNRLVPPLLLQLSLTIGLLITLIHQYSPLWLVPAISAGSTAIATIWIIRIAVAQVGPPYQLVWAEAKVIIQAHAQVFYSRLLITGYVIASPAIIAAVAGPSAVAIYNICDRIIQAVRLPFDIASTALFPISAHSYNKNHIKTFLLFAEAAALVIVLFGYAIAPTGLPILTGHDGIALLVESLRIYLLALIAIAAHGVIGNAVLIANGMRNSVTASIVAGFACYAIVLTLQWAMGHRGLIEVIWSMVFVELSILTVRYWYAHKKGLL